MLEDLFLINRLKAGDEKAFDKLYYKYVPLIKFIIHDIARNYDVIDDICQEVFTKFWNNINNFRGNNLKYYLVQIAKNETKNYLRSRQIEKKNLEKIYFYQQFASDTDIWYRISKELTELEQNILVLHFIYQLSFKDIADYVKMKKTSCYNIYKEALKKLKKFYAKGGVDDEKA